MYRSRRRLCYAGQTEGYDPQFPKYVVQFDAKAKSNTDESALPWDCLHLFCNKVRLHDVAKLAAP